MWLDIAKILLSAYGKKKEMLENKKEKLSKAFKDMADVMKGVTEDLKNDIYPMGSCIAMEELSRHIVSMVKDVLTEEETLELSKCLFVASKLEMEYAMRKSEDTIPALERAQGKLIALSIIYSI
jgi:hypothetical protein